jgi:hypothetical protein
MVGKIWMNDGTVVECVTYIEFYFVRSQYHSSEIDLAVCSNWGQRTPRAARM